MDKGLQIKELAVLIKASSATIINWEIHYVKPVGRNLKALERILGLNIM